MKLRLLTEAKEELQAGAQWYEDRREGLGEEFAAAVEATLERIEENNLLYPHYEFANPGREIRRALVKRFPYVVVYEVRADELLVLAVAHARQRPAYWKRRGNDEGPASNG